MLSQIFYKNLRMILIVKPKGRSTTIPLFPSFKKLEISDQEVIQKITERYRPYSDFSFISLWSWDIGGRMGISMLNDNLVIRFTDYVSGEIFYSFLGNNKVNETAEMILNFLKIKGLDAKLQLLPESMANCLSSEFKLIENRDHFDYIYRIEDLSNFPGSGYKNKRYLYRKFETLYGRRVRIASLDHIGEKDVQEMLSLDRKWASRKVKKLNVIEIDNEISAMERFLADFSKFRKFQFVFLKFYVDENLVGFSVYSIFSKDYIICHFNKGDIEYQGIYEYMLKKGGERFSGVAQYMNYEQDLGYPSLRFSKQSFNPAYFLKKYAIIKKTNLEL
jgi:hypothetical protein